MATILELISNIDNLLDELDALAGVKKPVVAYRDEDLRIPCAASDPDGEHDHKHHCGQCNITWKHEHGVQRATLAQFNLAHTCPRCGDYITTKHGY